MTRAMGLVYIVAACVFGCGEKLDPRLANDGVPTDGDAVEDASLAAPGEVVYTSNTATIKPILDTYCIRCHASTLSGNDRNSAGGH